MGQSPTKQANGYAEHGQRSETHSVDVDTDSAGAGSATATWDDGFGGNVHVFTETPEDANSWVSSKGNSQATINVGSAATTNGTVTVEVVAFGDDA